MTSGKNDKIEMLLDMVEHPERYSEEDVSRLAGDTECREIYDIMAKARRGFENRNADEVSKETIDEEWRKFAARNYPRRTSWHWRKYAAAFAGVLMLSGIALAAIHVSRVNNGKPKEETEVVETAAKDVRVPEQVAPTDSTLVKPRQFENVPLCEILTEMAAYYGMKVVYKSDNAKEMRLYFRWNPQDGPDKAAESLNMFNKVDVLIDGETMVVE